MVRSKKIITALLVLCFLIFPFGQLLSSNLLDILVAAIAVLYLAESKLKIQTSSLFSLVLIFSFAVSLTSFNPSETLIGFLYLLRLFSYLILPLAIMQTKISKLDLQKYLVLASLTASIFGLLQYLLLPDLRFLKTFGWDDHYFRLTFPFLDPAYTGIVFVVTILYLLGTKMFTKHKFNLMLAILVSALALSFSRASLGALIVGLVFLQYKNSISFLKIIHILVLIFIIIAIAPKPGGEGVNLARVNSLVQKLENYDKGFEIIHKYPLFGVGFNNLCLVRERSMQNSNACHGLDNSFLFIWATSGILGLIAFTHLVYQIFKRSNFQFKAILLAIIFHSLFTNTLFYNFIMFWLCIAWVSFRDDTLRLD